MLSTYEGQILIWFDKIKGNESETITQKTSS